MGVCGDIVDLDLLIEWCRAGFTRDTKPELFHGNGFECIHWCPKKLKWTTLNVNSDDSSVQMCPIAAPRFAIGSGAALAMAAMAAGASPPQAVRIAARYDLFTKPPFKTITYR